MLRSRRFPDGSGRSALGITGRGARTRSESYGSFEVGEIDPDHAAGQVGSADNLSAMLGSKAADVPLKDGDIVFIPSSAAKSAMKRGLEAGVQAAVGVAIYGRYKLDESRADFQETAINMVGAILPLLLTLFTIPRYLRLIGDVRFGVLAMVWRC